SDIPFVLRLQCPRCIGETRRNERELVSYGAHRTKRERRLPKLRPLATADFAAAREHHCTIERTFSAGLSGAPIISHARLTGTEKRLASGWIGDSSSDGAPIFDHRNRNAPLRNSGAEFLR